MSPSFFQMVGSLQRKVEAELEVLDVRNWGPRSWGAGWGSPGWLAVRKVGVWGLTTFLSLVSPSLLSQPAPWSNHLAPKVPGSAAHPPAPARLPSNLRTLQATVSPGQ